MTVDRLLEPPNQFFASDAIPGQLLGNAVRAIRARSRGRLCSPGPRPTGVLTFQY